MKSFLRFFVVTILLASTVFIYLLVLYPRTLEKTAKSLLEYCASNKYRTTLIEELDISYGKIELKNITVYNNEEWRISASNITIDYDVKKSIKKLGLYFYAEIADFRIDDITLNASGACVIKNSSTKIDNLKIVFNDNSYIKADMLYKIFLGELYLLEANIEAIEVPIMLHKAFWNLFPDNDIVSFMREFVLNGIFSGSAYVNLDKKFFSRKILDPKDLSGKFFIKSMNLKYSEIFPVVTSLNSEVVLNGTNIDFNILSANWSEILLKDSIVSIDWGNSPNTKVICNINGNGPAIGLMRFIPLLSLEAMKGYNVDLTRIKGIASVSGSVIIPLKVGTTNTYNIDAKISGASLDVLNGAISAKNGKLSGNFNGSSVFVNGPIVINGFNSQISYQMNLSDVAADFDHAFDIKMQLSPNLLNSKNYGLSISKGSAAANFHYKLKENSSSLFIDSDLKNLDLLVDKVGLYKQKGTNAYFKVSGSSNHGPIPSNLDISLIGGDGLKIIGTFEGGDNKKRLNLSTVKYDNTDLIAEFVFGDGLLKVDISGTSLDMSRANMMKFLDKSADSRDTDININLKTIKMKNDIWIDNFLMNVLCDKVKCYRGAIDSRIGSRSFKMSLESKDNEEDWQFYTTNAGALLKAIGVYTKMLAGNMMININTSRQEVRVGEQINILDGDFSLSKFVITDMPFLTKMISFTSLKGIMPFNSNNKVNFVKMNGKFGYRDGVVKIKDNYCEGQNFNFTMSGSIDTNEQIYKLKGFIIPSVYGFNTIFRKIPVVGNVISAPYFLKDKY